MTSVRLSCYPAEPKKNNRMFQSIVTDSLIVETIETLFSNNNVPVVDHELRLGQLS